MYRTILIMIVFVLISIITMAQTTTVIYPASWISSVHTDCKLMTLPATAQNRQVLLCTASDMPRLDANIRTELDPFFTPRGQTIIIEYAYLDPVTGAISYETPASDERYILSIRVPYE